MAIEETEARPYTKQEIPLSPENVKRIRQQLIPIGVFVVILMAFFTLMFSFIVDDIKNPFGDGEIIGYFFIVFALFFFGIVGYIIWIHVADLKAGIKYHITGEVIDKHHNVQRRSSSASGRTRGSSTTTHTYSLTIGNEKLKVELMHFNKVKVGDYISIEMAPKSNIIFEFDILETKISEKQQEEAIRKVNKFVAEPATETPFTREDYDALYNLFWSEFKKKLLWVAVPLFMVVSLVFSDMGFLLVFLFPIVLVLIFQLISGIRLGLSYKKSRDEGIKEVFSDILVDKLKHTSNGSSGQFKIKTTKHTLNVPEEVYNLLTTDSKVLIFKPKHMRKILSIMTADNKQYYFS